MVTGTARPLQLQQRAAAAAAGQGLYAAAQGAFAAAGGQEQINILNLPLPDFEGGAKGESSLRHPGRVMAWLGGWVGSLVLSLTRHAVLGAAQGAWACRKVGAGMLASMRIPAQLFGMLKCPPKRLWSWHH